MESSESPEAWETVSSQRLQRYTVLEVRRVRGRSPRTGQLRDFTVVDAPDGVTVLAITPERELVMVEQFRHGTGALSLETPSGLLEEGEAAVEAGLRELLEETGYEAEAARDLGTLAINPAWETARAHVVVATNARRVATPTPDDGEDLRTRLVPIDRVWSMVREGRIDAGVVLSALLLYRLDGERAGGSGSAE